MGVPRNLFISSGEKLIDALNPSPCLPDPSHGAFSTKLSTRWDISMKFISTWTFPPGQLNPAIKRFLESGGRPPEGVRMLGRWHGMDGRGFAVSEATDIKAIYQWYIEWADVLDLTVTPCVEDAEAGPILASLPQR